MECNDQSNPEVLRKLEEFFNFFQDATSHWDDRCSLGDGLTLLAEEGRRLEKLEAAQEASEVFLAEYKAEFPGEDIQGYAQVLGRLESLTSKTESSKTGPDNYAVMMDTCMGGGDGEHHVEQEKVDGDDVCEANMLMYEINLVSESDERQIFEIRYSKYERVVSEEVWVTYTADRRVCDVTVKNSSVDLSDLYRCGYTEATAESLLAQVKCRLFNALMPDST